MNRLPLQDRLDTAALLFDVVKPQRLYNPASKNGEVVGDSGTHLQGYAIRLSRTTPAQPKPVAHRVLVSNQLHGQVLIETIKPTLLLVPSAKCVDRGATLCPSPLPAPDPASHDLDHYKCYTVKAPKGAPAFPPLARVSVQDQFLSAPRLFDLKKPTLLCAPVDKNGEGLKDHETHLMCYKATLSPRQSRLPTTPGVHVSDQFGARTVNAAQTSELCVPSQGTLAEAVSVVTGIDHLDAGDGADE
jgi:hypothetical protein